MRLLAIVGLLLIVLGICALVFQGFTFFTTERVVDAGPFKTATSVLVRGSRRRSRLVAGRASRRAARS